LQGGLEGALVNQPVQQQEEPVTLLQQLHLKETLAEIIKPHQITVPAAAVGLVALAQMALLLLVGQAVSELHHLSLGHL